MSDLQVDVVMIPVEPPPPPSFPPAHSTLQNVCLLVIATIIEAVAR